MGKRREGEDSGEGKGVGSGGMRGEERDEKEGKRKGEAMNGKENGWLGEGGSVSGRGKRGRRCSREVGRGEE